ncbi:hypothetical protein GCM10009853_032180 [Glycomyces scopariae]
MERGLILAFNHRSMLDLFVAIDILAEWGMKPTILIKSTYFRIPGLNRLLRSVGGIPVDATSPVSVIRASNQVLRRGGILAIAPEGRIPRPYERTEGVGEFKPGVAKFASLHGCPILVVTMVNTDAAWPIGSKLPKFRVNATRRPAVRVATTLIEVSKSTDTKSLLHRVHSDMRRLLRELREPINT